MMRQFYIRNSEHFRTLTKLTLHKITRFRTVEISRKLLGVLHYQLKTVHGKHVRRYFVRSFGLPHSVLSLLFTSTRIIHRCMAFETNKSKNVSCPLRRCCANLFHLRVSGEKYCTLQNEKPQFAQRIEDDRIQKGGQNTLKHVRVIQRFIYLDLKVRLAVFCLCVCVVLRHSKRL